MQDHLPLPPQTPAPPDGIPPEGDGALHPARDSWFRSLVEQSIAGTYVIRDGRFVYVNPKLAELFRYEVDEIVARRGVGDLVVPEDRERVLEHVRQRLEGEVESIHQTFGGLRRDGSRIEVETHGTRAELGGEPVVIGLLLDITERVRLERERAELLREAREAVLAREEVLAIVSHDLRNPLNAITMTTDFLLLQEREEERVRMLRRMKRLAARMEVLIRDLLDVSSLEAGRLSVDPGSESVREILQAAQEMVLPQAEEKGVELEVRGAEATVLADHDRIVQVLSNLAGNALKFTSPGGRIVLRATVEAQAVRFEVEDTGCGIPEEDRRRLFEPYWKGGGGDGAGLGLSIARGIVEAHGAEIRVESEVGKGTRIGFSLARHRASASG